MPTSAAFHNSPPVDDTQRLLLCLIAVFLPPLPLFLLTRPNPTVRTKEFWTCLLLTVLFGIGGVLYAIYFICFEFPGANNGGYIRVGDDEEQCPACVDEAPTPKPAGSTRVERSETPTDGLPSYEDLERTSQGAPATKTAGDHKVQH